MTGVGVSELEQHLGYWLRFVSNAVSQGFRDRVATHGVTVAEWVALRSLHACAPCTLGALASELGLDAGGASRLVERLVRKRLATRTSATGDRRRVTLALTAAGRRLVPRLAREADDNDARWFAALSKTDRAHLFRILGALVHAHGLRTKPTE